MNIRVRIVLASALAFVGPASGVWAQPGPGYGFDWVTVGAPGNRPATATEAPEFFAPFSIPDQHVGRVDHEFRITRTEVTVGQWFEFVDAFWPHWDGSYWDTALTGPGLCRQRPSRARIPTSGSLAARRTGPPTRLGSTRRGT